MKTNLRTELESLDYRWEELDTLSTIARNYYHAQEEGKEYRALCRTTTVLTCSHLEGALKSVSRAYVCDLNDFSSFENAPTALQRQYVSEVLLASGDKVDQNAVSRLVAALSRTNFKMNDKELFLKNRNPSKKIVDRFYKMFKGEKADIFTLLASSRLTVVFLGDQAKSKRLLADIRKSCLRGSENYPYVMSKHYFERENEATTASDMFGPFIEDLLQKRHDIVHGNTLSNDLGIVAIDDYIMKAKLLLYGYVLAICQ